MRRDPAWSHDRPVGIADLIARARGLVIPGERRLLGIAGPPGAGKSTVSRAIAEALKGDAVVVGMDAFHLSNSVLEVLDRRDRKGAPDTFDVEGYAHLLHRLREGRDSIVYAGEFDRVIEETIAGVVPVPRDVPLIITEGNYLLREQGEWGKIRPLLDECWFIDPGDDVRIPWLASRHRRFGKSLKQARSRSLGSDQQNARTVLETRERADLVITKIDWG